MHSISVSSCVLMPRFNKSKKAKFPLNRIVDSSYRPLTPDQEDLSDCLYNDNRETKNASMNASMKDHHEKKLSCMDIKDSTIHQHLYPQNHTKDIHSTSLHGLPKETLLHILDYLHYSDLQTTCLVSNYLRECSLLYLWQDPCRLLVSQSRAFQVFESLLLYGSMKGLSYARTLEKNAYRIPFKSMRNNNIPHGIDSIGKGKGTLAALVKRFELNSSQQSPYTSPSLIFSVIQSCNNLRHLSFKYCQREIFNDASQTQLIVNGLTQLQHLQFLDLSHQTNLMTDVNARQLAFCKGLRVLKVSFCSFISEEALQILVRSLDGLHTLDISYIYKVSDVLLQDLEACLPYLMELDISGCWNVSRNGIIRLMQNKSSLQSLIFTH